MPTIFDQVAAGRSLWVDLALDTSSLADALHCTLRFWGKEVSPIAVQRLLWACAELSHQEIVVTARIGGRARFRGNAREGDPVVWLLQSPRIRAIRALLDSQCPPTRPDDWDYTPHVTLGRVPQDVVLEVESPMREDPIVLTHLRVCCGDHVTRFPLAAP